MKQIATMAARLDFYERAWPTQEYVSYVREHRLDIKTIGYFAGGCGVIPIMDCGGGRFDFTGTASNMETVNAFVCEAFDVDGETAVDLVAWPLNRPKHVLTMFGQAGLLGLWAAHNPATFFMGGWLHLHRTPLDWLKSGCCGAAIVTPHIAARQLVDVPGRIEAVDRLHGREIHWLMHSAIDIDNKVIVPKRRAA